MHTLQTFVPVPKPITPRWLTAMLRQSGVLRQGVVTSIETESTGAHKARTTRLRLHYWAGANPESPARVLLKQNTSYPWGKTPGMQEVQFYQFVGSFFPHPPGAVPCYAAAYDQRSGDSYLLLHDLAQTHRPFVTGSQGSGRVKDVPSDTDFDTVVDTLAAIHAYWWDHPALEAGPSEVESSMRNTERFVRNLLRCGAAWADLISHEHAWFPKHLRDLYELVLNRLEEYLMDYLLPRYYTNRNLTLAHGDGYFWNFQCPKDGKAGPTYLLDWQTSGVDIPGYDLANLCAANWTPHRHHDDIRELVMLLRYHNALHEHGVTSYTLDELKADYQTGLIFWLLAPVHDRYHGAGKDSWWPKMQCFAAAFQDWHCDKLLGI